MPCEVRGKLDTGSIRTSKNIPKSNENGKAVNLHLLLDNHGPILGSRIYYRIKKGENENGWPTDVQLAPPISQILYPLVAGMDLLLMLNGGRS